jgi:hypothetical protein
MGADEEGTHERLNVKQIEHLLEFMAMRIGTAASGHVHVDQTIGAIGVFPGHQIGVGVARQVNMLKVCFVGMDMRKSAIGIIRRQRLSCGAPPIFELVIATSSSFR